MLAADASCEARVVGSDALRFCSSEHLSDRYGIVRVAMSRTAQRPVSLIVNLLQSLHVLHAVLIPLDPAIRCRVVRIENGPFGQRCVSRGPACPGNGVDGILSQGWTDQIPAHQRERSGVTDSHVSGFPAL